MDVAANGNWLCVALQIDRPGRFAICDLRGNDKRTTYLLKSGDPDVELLKIHPNNTHVVAVGQRHLEIVKLDDGMSHDSYDIGNGITQDIEFSKDGEELFVSKGAAIHRFSWNGGYLLLKQQISRLPYKSCEIEISEDGKLLYVAGRNGLIQKFVEGPEGDFFAPRVVGHRKEVEKFAFDGANRYVATVSKGVEFSGTSSSVVLWDTLMNGEEVFWIPEGEGFEINSAKLSDDGGVLAVAYAGLISLWDIGQRKLVSQIQHEDASLSSPKVKHIEFESGSRKLMSFWSDGSVSVHLVDALCAPTKIGTFQNPNTDVDIAPLISGNLLFIGNKVCSFPDTDDAELKAVPLKWSPLTNRDFKTNIISRALSDKHIAMATNSGQIYVWRKLDELGYSEARLLEADMRVPGIAFNSDGDLIGYRDHRIFVWNLTSGGRREFEIPKRSYEMSFLGFSKDGKKCVLRSMFGLVEILDLNFEE